MWDPSDRDSRQSSAGRTLRRLPFAVVLCVRLLEAVTLHAQTREADAERLFREGQKLMEERRYGEACPKFDAAYKKDGALGTLLNLAFCHQEQGAIWYAWLEFREADVKATDLNLPDRRDFARARLSQLQKSLPRVSLDNPLKVPLADVLVEDRKVWNAEAGEPFAVEAGARKFTFRAKGKKPKTVLVSVARTARGTQRVRVPMLEDLTAEDLPPPVVDTPPPPPRVASVAPAPADVALPPRSSAQRTVGWITIGTGAAALGIGGVTGALAVFGPCGGKNCSPDERDSASTMAAISTTSFIVGGAAVVGGVLVLLTAPSRIASSPRGTSGASYDGVGFAIGPAGASVSGTF